MGYDYCFLLAIEAFPEEWKHLSLLELCKTWNVYETRLKEASGRLKSNPWFPIFGEIDTSGSRGYGVCEQEDHPVSDLLEFTLEFPEFTFAVYYLHWDFDRLIVYRLRGGELLERSQISNDNVRTVTVGSSKFRMLFHPEYLDIDNNITYLFSEGRYPDGEHLDIWQRHLQE